MTLRALPSSFDPPSLDLSAKAKPKTEKQIEAERDAKDDYRAQVEDLAHGMVLIGVPDGSAWEVEFEWSDSFADGCGLEGLTKGSRDKLQRLADTFPEAGISRISRALLTRLAAAEAAARPPVDGDAADAPQEGNDGLAKAPHSIVAHLLAVSFFRSQKEWDAVVPVAEAGLLALAPTQTEIGRALPSLRQTCGTRRALETSLGLVHRDPSTHHLRALRLLESLLGTAPPPPSFPSAPALPHTDPELLFAKAIVLQMSNEQAAALKVRDQIIALPPDSTPDQTQQAYDAYISALRASPSYAPAFTSLGIYYRSLATPDWERSSNSYLAEELAELGEWSLVEVIARRGIDGTEGRAGMGGMAAARLAWAWKAIGGSELNSKKYPQAITAFQSALRGTPDDVSTWIKLGVAYRHSGKHVAALKVFAKALALDPSSWFAKYSIADVQREIGLLDPAVKAFKEILVDRPDELGVKVVLAQTALAKGLGEQKQGYMVHAEESLLEALEDSMAVIEGGSASRVAWKVTAEALVGLSRLSNPASPDSLGAALARLLTYLSKQDVDGKMAGLAAVTVADVRAAVNTKPAVTAAALAVLSLKMRVLLETQNKAAIGSAWFDLGVAISSFRPHLSALSTSSRVAVPWTNLGLFYLVHGDEDLANQVFLKAQVLDPEWAAAWVGQATLADMAGHAVEASVRLEHAVSLGGDAPEADIAFASRAFKKYRSSVPSSSLAVAVPSPTPPPSAIEVLSGPLFSLGRYLSHRPSDHTALHLNALILKQVGDLASACESFEKAAAIIEELWRSTSRLPSRDKALATAIDDVESYRIGACDDHLAVALGRVHWAEVEENRALSALLDSPDIPSGRQTPLFLRRAIYAYTIAANDTSLLQTTDSFTWNAAVEYDPDILHLSTPSKLVKNDIDGALSTVSHSLHAFPWAPAFRSRTARLLASLPPVASDATDTNNLEFVCPFTRTRIPQTDASSLRARRSRALGIVALHKVGEAETEEEANRLDEEALRFLEKGVYMAP
ncbi:Superkiller protein 3 [Rhodotorula toruloides]